jgi:hypothetical protein
LSLCIVGIAYTVNQVVLNPHYIVRILNEIDFSQIIQEQINTQPSSGNLPPELQAALIYTFRKIEPAIKKQIGIALEDTYTYLKGKRAIPNFKGTLSKSMMNSQFVADLLDKVDLPQLIDQALKNQTGTGTGFSDDSRNALIKTIDDHQPSLKKQIVNASVPIFGYLLMQSSSVDLKTTLRQTILSDSFMSEVINSLDSTTTTKDIMTQMTRDLLTYKIGNQLPKGITLSDDQIDSMATAIEPTFKTGLANSIGPIVDFLLGNKQNFNVSIPITPAIPTLKTIVKEAYMAQLPAKLQGLPQTSIDIAFEQYFTADVQPEISSLELNSTDLGLNMSGDIATSLTKAQNSLTDARNSIDKTSQDIENNLKKARTYVEYFRLGFACLIALIIVFIVGIILICRSVKDSCRNLGIVFFIYGAGMLAVVLIAKYFAIQQFAKLNIPQALNNVPGILLNDVTSPLRFVSLVCLIGGFLMTVTSFVYPRLKWSKIE